MIYINEAVPLPKNLPKTIISDIEVLQQYYEEGNENYYYPYLDGFEGTIKGCYLEGLITEEEARQLMRRYGI